MTASDQPSNIHPILRPNRFAISSHLFTLFSPGFVKAYPEAFIEIAYGPPDRGPARGRWFSAFDLADACTFAETANLDGNNVYVVPALLQGEPGSNGRGTNANYLDSAFAWVDADKDFERVRALLEQLTLVPALTIITGLVPERRTQFYFKLIGPVSSNQLQTTNRTLADRLGTDEVSSPTHLMRLAGTINYPSAKKAARGYADGIVTIDLAMKPVVEVAYRPDLPGDPLQSPADDPWARFAAEASGTRKGREDGELYGLLEASRQPGHWHNSIRDAIATMVGRGWDEAAVRLACAPYCQGGAADPDLDPLIDGAVRKWGRAGMDESPPGTGKVSFTEAGQATGFNDRPKTSPPVNTYELHWHDAAAETPVQAWLVKDLLPETGTGLMSGQWGTGKSLAALDLAGSLATGLPFAGHEVSRRGGVLYVAAEGASAMAARLKALVDHKLRAALDPFAQAAAGHPVADASKVDLDRLPIAWIANAPNIQNARDRELLAATIKVAALKLQNEFGVPLSLIVIDTMGRVGNFKDANDTAENQRVMNWLGHLGEASGAFVLALDHFGKDVTTGTRNSSAKEDYADVVLAFVADRALTGALSNTVMGVRKSRVGNAGAEISYDLTLVELDNGDTGRVVTWKEKRVSEPIGGAAKPRWSKGHRMFKVVFDNALLEHGMLIRPYGAEGPQVRAVTYEALRRVFMKSYPAENAATKRSAFSRALAEVRKVGNLICSEEIGGVDHLWLVDDVAATAEAAMHARRAGPEA